MVHFDYKDRFGRDNYSFMFPFERNFVTHHSTEWMDKYWGHSVTFSAIYVMAIYGGQRLMRNRKAFDLQQPLALWNSALALFSLVGFLRMTPEMLWCLSARGLQYSMCSTSFAQGVPGFWTQMFAISKLIEFGDTAFIVLRRRPVTFLHWYHHVTVLMYTWHAYKGHTASGRWFILMNYTVHAFMYGYYALRAMRFRPAKWVPMIITFLQLTQMVVGIIIALNVYRIKINGDPCQQTFNNLYLSFTIYFTYFLLFCNFFYHAYLKKNNRYAKIESAVSAKGDRMISDGIRLNGYVVNGQSKKGD